MPPVLRGLFSALLPFSITSKLVTSWSKLFHGFYKLFTFTMRLNGNADTGIYWYIVNPR